MSKNIVIIGAGISGLSLLHYLNKAFEGDETVNIKVLEKNSTIGGTINTLIEQDCLFETGPNGFLNNNPATFDLINDVDLGDDLITAEESAKSRFVLYNNSLHQLPNSLKSFLGFSPLSFMEKLGIIKGIFQTDSIDDQMSIYEYGKQKFGERFAELFMDSFVKGVYGSDAKKISLKAAFPKIYRMEKENGSLFKGFRSAQKNKPKGEKGKRKKTQLKSFNKGMSVVTNRIASLYKEQIICDAEIKSINSTENGYSIQANGDTYEADMLFLCCPAYNASNIVKNENSQLAQLLKSITYSSLAVVGLRFKKEQLKKCPEGFGYLIPSINNKKILGALIESNIFDRRCGSGHILFRAMISLEDDKSKDDNVATVLEELRERFGIEGEPDKLFYKEWHNAIPEYSLEYLNIIDSIKEEINKMSNFYVCANYLDGISFNDCIFNAQNLARTHVNAN